MRSGPTVDTAGDRATLPRWPCSSFRASPSARLPGAAGPRGDRSADRRGGRAVPQATVRTRRRRSAIWLILPGVFLPASLLTDLFQDASAWIYLPPEPDPAQGLLPTSARDLFGAPATDAPGTIRTGAYSRARARQDGRVHLARPDDPPSTPTCRIRRPRGGPLPGAVAAGAPGGRAACGPRARAAPAPTGPTDATTSPPSASAGA
jgi:hypothetical protein